MDNASLVLPTFLPGGQSLMVDSDFYDRLHNGDASIGWVGDPSLGVYHSDDCVELWRHCADGETRMIMRSRPGLTSLGTEALRFLAEHDSQSRRQYDAVAETNAHNDRIRRREAADRDAQMEDVADRLQFGLRKDLGAYEGGSTRRLMPLPAAPWKRDQ